VSRLGDKFAEAADEAEAVIVGWEAGAKPWSREVACGALVLGEISVSEMHLEGNPRILGEASFMLLKVHWSIAHNDGMATSTSTTTEPGQVNDAARETIDAFRRRKDEAWSLAHRGLQEAARQAVLAGVDIEKVIDSLRSSIVREVMES